MDDCHGCKYIEYCKNHFSPVLGNPCNHTHPDDDAKTETVDKIINRQEE